MGTALIDSFALVSDGQQSIFFLIRVSALIVGSYRESVPRTRLLCNLNLVFLGVARITSLDEPLGTPKSVFLPKILDFLKDKGPPIREMLLSQTISVRNKRNM